MLSHFALFFYNDYILPRATTKKLFPFLENKKRFQYFIDLWSRMLTRIHWYKKSVVIIYLLRALWLAKHVCISLHFILHTNPIWYAIWCPLSGLGNWGSKSLQYAQLKVTHINKVKLQLRWLDSKCCPYSTTPVSSYNYYPCAPGPKYFLDSALSPLP